MTDLATQAVTFRDAAVRALADQILAEQRVVHLQPARPRRTRTVAALWAWGALAIPCRDLDEHGVRCGLCPPCEARTEALRAWCP